MSVPAVPGAAFVMVEAEFVFGGLETFLDTPACAVDLNQFLNGCSSGAPGGEEGAFAICKAAPDQQAAGPYAWNWRVVFGSLEIGQWAVGPVIEPLTLRAMTGGQALPERDG